MVTCVLRHKITAHRASPPELQRGPLRRKCFAYQGISLRLSHAAAAAGEEENHQQDQEPTEKDRQIKSTTPRLKFVTFDQAQHDLGVATRESWAKERYADQIANFLPIEPTFQPENRGWLFSSSGCHKADKLFVNKVLKDKGPLSHDWRIALSDLLEHTVFEKLDNPKNNDHVLSLFPNDGSHSQDLRGSNEDQGPVQRVPAYSRNYRYFRLARDITIPVEWSEANLAIYVEALAESQRTLARVPWAQKPQLKGWTNLGDVVTAFDTIFYGVASQTSLSIKACNAALRFFYDNGLLAKARALYIRMEDLRMPILTETFNIMLRGSASQKDLHNFTFLLKVMIRRGYKPNEVTWTLFLQVASSEGRAVIVRKMTEMKMLDKLYIRRTVAKHMIPFEINNHLGNGHDHYSILDHMNSKYGVGWISTSAGNMLLHEVAMSKSTAESLSLLYGMKQVGFEPDDVSMATLLRHCSRSGQYDLAIEILDAFKNLYRLHPGPQAYEALFMQAWRKRRLNFCTVVWKYACIYGAVSTKVQKLVYLSLLVYTPARDKPIQSDDPVEPSNLSRLRKFKKFAGRFVIGLNSAEGANLSHAMDTHEQDLRRRTKKWARLLVGLSLRISRTCEVESGLSQMLRQAVTMDIAWAVEGLYKKDDWREMFQHAIAVPVRYVGKPPRRSRRSRKHVHHGGSAASQLRLRQSRKGLGNLPERLDDSNFIHLSPDVRMRMKSRILKSLRNPAGRREKKRPIPLIRSASPLATLWRERLTQEAARIRVRRGLKFKSYEQRVRLRHQRNVGHNPF